MREKTDEQKYTWRDNWFVKNVLAEIPVIGGFFKTAQLGHALHHATKSSFMLLGGTTVMMLNLMQISENDAPGEKFAKMTGGMAVGMTGGMVLYNTLFSMGQKTIEAGNRCCHQESNDDAQSLLPTRRGVNF